MPEAEAMVGKLGRSFWDLDLPEAEYKRPQRFGWPEKGFHVSALYDDRRNDRLKKREKSRRRLTTKKKKMIY